MKIEQIIEELHKAEQLEAVATKHRQIIEAELFEALKPELKKSEGQETIEKGNFKLTVNQPQTYKLDEEKYRKLAEEMPEELQFHRTQLDLDKTKWSSLILQKNDPEIKKYAKKIQNCVTSKPGKPSIKINIKEV